MSESLHTVAFVGIFELPAGCSPLPETAPAADGTHPTGMHSCSERISESK